MTSPEPIQNACNAISSIWETDEFKEKEPDARTWFAAIVDGKASVGYRETGYQGDFCNPSWAYVLKKRGVDCSAKEEALKLLINELNELETATRDRRMPSFVTGSSTPVYEKLYYGNPAPFCVISVATDDAKVESFRYNFASGWSSLLQA
jgi:hypothetical protein